jgi:DNA-binding SARP family transcriptional activator
MGYVRRNDVGTLWRFDESSVRKARIRPRREALRTIVVMAVTVSLLGELAARAGERAVPAPTHPQGLALLAWLALHPGEHDRGPLAALLWPDLAPSAARTELRRAAWALRRALAPHDSAVLDGRTTLGLRCTTDLEQFDAHVAAGETAAALALCRGPLLAGFEEHEWVLAARAEHAESVAGLRAARPA